MGAVDFVDFVALVARFKFETADPLEWQTKLLRKTSRQAGRQPKHTRRAASITRRRCRTNATTRRLCRSRVRAARDDALLCW